MLRRSLAGVVPEEVVLRPKTSLAGQPGAFLLAREESRWIDDFIATPQLARYIDRKRVPRVWGATNISTAWMNLRPLSLDFWLQQQAAH
jgi:hypothetical protein